MYDKLRKDEPNVAKKQHWRQVLNVRNVHILRTSGTSGESNSLKVWTYLLKEGHIRINSS